MFLTMAGMEYDSDGEPTTQQRVENCEPDGLRPPSTITGACYDHSGRGCMRNRLYYISSSAHNRCQQSTHSW